MDLFCFLFCLFTQFLDYQIIVWLVFMIIFWFVSLCLNTFVFEPPREPVEGWKAEYKFLSGLNKWMKLCGLSTDTWGICTIRDRQQIQRLKARCLILKARQQLHLSSVNPTGEKMLFFTSSVTIFSVSKHERKANLSPIAIFFLSSIVKVHCFWYFTQPFYT